MVAARLANLSHGGDRRSDQAANLPVGPISQLQAATALNASERSVRDAVKVMREGAPEVVQAVDQGRLAVNAAVKAVALPREQQYEDTKPCKTPAWFALSEGRPLFGEVDICLVSTEAKGALGFISSTARHNCAFASIAAINSSASPISRIPGVGEKPSSAGARTALASAGREVDW